MGLSNSINAEFKGTLNSVGDFSVATNKFNVTAATGNTTVAGTLDSAGDFSVATNKLTVASATGNTTLADDAVLALGSSGTALTTLQKFSSSTGDAWTTDINNVQLRLQAANANSEFVIRSLAGENLTKWNKDGIITGPSSIPASITGGTVLGCLIDSDGRIRSSTTATSAQTHRYFYNPNGLVGSISTSGTQLRIGASQAINGQVSIIVNGQASFLHLQQETIFKILVLQLIGGKKFLPEQEQSTHLTKKKNKWMFLTKLSGIKSYQLLGLTT
jgi:hypothetical protein